MDPLGPWFRDRQERIDPGSGTLSLALTADPSLSFKTEVSYLDGKPVGYGTPGSVRLDAVVWSEGKIIAVFDLKTGGATLTEARIQQIRSHLPPYAQAVPILEVRP